MKIDLVRAPRIVVVGLAASVLLLVITSEAYSGFHVWEVGSALLNQGKAFSEGSVRIAEGTVSRIWIVALQAAAAPLTMIVIPNLALAWFERRKHLLLFVISAAVPVTQSILVGRDFQSVLTAILIFCAWLISRLRKRSYFSWRDAAALGGAAIVFLFAFGARKMSRNPFDVPICPPGTTGCTASGPPSLWDSVVVQFSSYATQSFEGLSRALFGTWHFGGGYSHSAAVAGLAKSLFGPRSGAVITDQLEKFDWSSTNYWSTGLAWIANDVPWLAVPAIVALQGVLLASVWRSAIERADLLSVALFGYTWVSLFFMMQNLQLALSGPIYAGYLVLVVLYLSRAIRSKLRRRRASLELEVPPIHVD